MKVIPASNDLLRGVDERRKAISDHLDAKERARLGQFFTPTPVAKFIAALPSLPETGKVRILDPGAGNGSLTAALIARIATERPDLEIAATAFEIDEALRPELQMTLDGCEEFANTMGTHITTEVIIGDFLEWAALAIETLPYSGNRELFDIAIMNPPYRKINVRTSERKSLKCINVEVTNLYVAFVAMSTALLDTGGQLAAITPRSFANGPYFRSFRRYFFNAMFFDRLHVYESRSKAFSDDAVLQENVIFSAHRRRDHEVNSLVTISTSHGPTDTATTRIVQHSEVVRPNDPECFVHIMPDDADAALGKMLVELPTRMTDLGIEISTGRVVDFRAKTHLRFEPESGTVPLIYPGHLRDGAVVWPGDLRRKPSWIVDCDATASLMLPTETYVLVKRFTTKEERRRVTAAVFDPGDVPTNVIGFENHLNVFHIRGHGLPSDLARGLAAWLNSTVVDRYVRFFNGHTQINATDLRSLPYPSDIELRCLGDALGSAPCADQEKIDALVAFHVKSLRDIAA